MSGSEKGRGVFRIAGGKAAPALEMKNGVLHQVAQFVEVSIVGTPDQAMFSGRYDRSHALTHGLADDGIGIVASVRHQAVGPYSLNEP